jgi:tetratricopeptide (TPR) repeat protein
MIVNCLVGVLILLGLQVGKSDPTLADADNAFLRIDYPEAVATYQQVLLNRPDDPEILWHLARVYVCQGEIAGDQDRERLLRLGEQYARRCTEVDSNCAEGHTWLAGAIGFIALDAGLGDRVALSHELLKETDRALLLNPSDDVALSIRGSFFRVLGNVSWFERQIASLFIGSVPRGGYQESEEALLKAVALAPDVMRHQYELGVLYLDMGRKEEARKILEHALTLPVRIASDRPRKEKIVELLGELRND